jgi:WD40 repeat protein
MADNRPVMTDISLSAEDRRLLRAELARTYPSSAAADPVLSAIGFGRERRPSIDATTPFQAWNEILNELDRGVVADPYRNLLVEVLRYYPANRAFVGLAEKYGVVAPPIPPPRPVDPEVPPQPGEAELVGLRGSGLVRLAAPAPPMSSTGAEPIQSHVFEHPPPTGGGWSPELLAVAFSPDSRRLVTADDGGGARLWDAERRTPCGVLAHPGAVPKAVFSPDSSLLATACQDSRVRLWDVETGRTVHELARLPAGPGTRYTLAFSSDGRHLAVGSRPGGAWWWDVRTGRPGREPIVTGQEEDAAMSLDGRLAALTVSPDQVEVRDFTDGSRRAFLLPHHSRVVTVRFSPDSRWLATVEYARLLRLWDPATRLPVFETRHPVLEFDISLDGRSLATWGSGDVIEVTDIPRASGAPGRRRSPFEGGRVEGTPTFGPHGRWLCIHNPANRTVRLCDLSSEPAAGHRLAHQAAVNAVAFHPGGRRLVAATAAGRAVEWSLPAQAARASRVG